MNKKELFAFLTSKIESFSWPPTKSVCVTSGQAVSACGLSVPMDDCNYEEADTRIMVHNGTLWSMEQRLYLFVLLTLMLWSSL